MIVGLILCGIAIFSVVYVVPHVIEGIIHMIKHPEYYESDY